MTTCILCIYTTTCNEASSDYLQPANDTCRLGRECHDIRASIDSRVTINTWRLQIYRCYHVLYIKAQGCLDISSLLSSTHLSFLNTLFGLDPNTQHLQITVISDAHALTYSSHNPSESNTLCKATHNKLLPSVTPNFPAHFRQDTHPGQLPYAASTDHW